MQLISRTTRFAKSGAGVCAAQRDGMLLYRGKRKLTCNSNTRSSAAYTCTWHVERARCFLHTREVKHRAFWIRCAWMSSTKECSQWTPELARDSCYLYVIYLYNRDRRTYARVCLVCSWSRFIRDTRIELQVSSSRRNLSTLANECQSWDESVPQV